MHRQAPNAPSSTAAHRPAPPRRVESKAEVVERVINMLKTRTRAKNAVAPLFRAMDEDREGGVSHHEFIAQMRRLGLQEPDHKLKWVAEAIDNSGQGRITFAAFGTAVSPALFEDGLCKPALKTALEEAQGERPPRMRTHDFPSRPAPTFPDAPRSLKGGAASLGTKQAWSEWGGVPQPAAAAAASSAADNGNAASSSTVASRPGEASRLAQRADARARHKVQLALDALRTQVEMHGSVKQAFRKLEASGDSKISADELQKALRQRFNIDMSAETTRDVMREFDVDGDGEIEYREFVSRLLGKFDIDVTGGRTGARGGGGAHVEMEQLDAERKAAQARNAGGELNASRRHEAAVAMESMRKRLLAKHANLRDAFRSIDVDSDNTLSYEEFGTLVSQWMPDLQPMQVHDVCRLLDADGDGMIDFDEFASVVASSGDDMKHSAAGLLRRREQKAVANMVNARKGRFGATPTFSYGIQMRELMGSYPGTTHYATENERLAPSVASQLVPEWQVTDAARKAQRTDVRREQMRFHTQRQEAVAASRQRASEMLQDARLDSIVAQRQRYSHAVATENVAKLKGQATFRITSGGYNLMPEQSAP